MLAAALGRFDGQTAELVPDEPLPCGKELRALIEIDNFETAGGRAANDGERAAYLDELNALFVEIEGQTSGAGVLAALGSFAQRMFGARVTLDAYRELITAPKSAAVRQPYVGPGMNGGVF